MASVHSWQELQRRRQLELLSAYGGTALQPSTFVPTTQLPLLAGSPGGVPGVPGVKGLDRPAPGLPRQLGRVVKHHKSKGSANGRTYTSKFRGVHQTFPTRRWEAQFRRSGKPTSLGCFDKEEEAARAYDKMMLWCEMHQASGVKGGITNFDPAEYEQFIPMLQHMSQDDLVQCLRSEGRRQAAQRMLRQKRDFQGGGVPDRQGPHHGDDE